MLLMVGCFGYLIDAFVHFLVPEVAPSIEFVVAPAAIGELAFVGWLLVKGIKVPEREEFVPAVA